MEVYIALLRGINVSGAKKIKMADLRAALAELAYKNLKTYIQSGNIVFAANEKTPEDLETEIKQKIQDQFGYDVPVKVLTLEALKVAVAENPFLQEGEPDPRQLYVTFIKGAIREGGIEALKGHIKEPEDFRLIGDRIYLYLPLGAARTKLDNNSIEAKLKVQATTRNWRTSNKLIEMGEEIA